MQSISTCHTIMKRMAEIYNLRAPKKDIYLLPGNLKER